MLKGWNCQAPLTFSSWNQIIEELRNIYKLKELISIPASVIIQFNDHLMEAKLYKK